MSHAAANVLGAGVLLLGIAYAWLLTGDFEQEAARKYPYAVLAFTGIVLTIWLVRSIRRLRSGDERDSASEGAGGLGSPGGYLVLGGTLIYGALVVYFGYVVPTLAYLAVMAYFLGGRNWLVIGSVAILFPLALYAFLVYGFDRPLPF